MKCVHKIVHLFVRPPKRPGFSRIDLLVLLLLGVVALASLFLHIGSPAPTTVTSSAVSAQATRAGVPGYAMALPAIPQATHRNPPVLGALRICPVAFNVLNLPQPDKANNVKSPFGTSDVLFFFTDPRVTVGICDVQQLSGLVLGLVNAFVVIILILAGLRIMLGGSVFRYASAIEVLPGILLALVAANLSLNIVALFLGLNNALTVDFYDQANKMPVTQAQFNGQDIVTKTCNHWDTVGGAALGALTNPIGIVAGAILGESLGCNVNPYVHNWQQILQSTTSPPNITGGASVTGFMFMFQSLSNLLQFITSILALMLMGQMVLRLFFIDLFIVTAPLGIGCWALPGRSGQSLTRLWLQGFFSTLFVQFLQVAALVVLRILIGAITSALYASFQSGVAGSAVNGDATLLWVIQIAQFWFLLRIPALLGTAPLNMLVNFGQTMAQTAQTAVAITAAELQFATSVGMSVVGSGVAAAAIAR